MAHILKNKKLEIHIDHPLEGYNFSRFDWTGKIVKVKFEDVELSSIERTDLQYDNGIGKGFYNEFGIDTALGFEEAKIGGWFHKIGVGLLKKDSAHYNFITPYEVDPAEFNVNMTSNGIIIRCASKTVNGHAYILTKEIKLHNEGFSINYLLENKGEKAIITDEYNHNFIAIQRTLIGADYSLNFPFELKPELFGEKVNPEGKVVLGATKIEFTGSPTEQFFFSNLTGSEYVMAGWELVHHKSGIGIKETTSFTTNKINLWGWKHVISPELFHKIHLKPGQSKEWSRKYEVFRINQIQQ